MTTHSIFTYRLSARALAIAIATTAPPSAALAQDSKVGVTDTGTQISDIVVTARKTAESVQKVPISITAFGEKEIAARSITSLSAASQSTPNFTFSQQAEGGGASAVIFMRGVGQADTLSVYDPAVGIYLDGVYYGRMQATDLDMLEVSRLEVLRGPQGTLFGKNTSGGAINIVTKRPDTTEVFGRVSVTTGSRNHFDILGSINVPLVENKVALQLSGVRKKQDGYGHRILTGEDMNSKNRWSGRAQLLIKPTDIFSVLLTGDVTNYKETNATFQLVAVNSNVPPIAALNAFTTSTYDNRYISPSPYDTYATGPNSSRGILWGTSATMSLEAGWATFKSITAYRDNKIHNDLDPDSSPVIVLNQFQQVAQHQLSQELQATGKGLDNRLNWVAGLYYFHEQARDNIHYNVLPALAGTAFDFSQNLNVRNDSYAGYTQGTFSASSKLRVTAGLRLTVDKKQVTRKKFGSDDLTTIQPTTTLSLSSTAVSPRLGIDYQWTPNVMTYLSVAQGYKAGGFNGRASSVAEFTKFNSEKVWTYEVGLRSDLFDRRVRFNATGFYSDYRDLQLPISGSTVVNGAPVPFYLIANVPKARVTGGEVELAVIPTKGLTLSGALGLTYTKYTQLPSTAAFLAAGTITKANTFPHTPKASYNLSAQYQTDLTRYFNFLIRTDYAYKSQLFFNPENTLALRQKAYGLLNARIAVTHKPSEITLALFGANLTKTKYITGGFDDATTANPGLGFAIVTPGAPREWGLSLEMKF